MKEELKALKMKEYLNNIGTGYAEATGLIIYLVVVDICKFGNWEEVLFQG